MQQIGNFPKSRDGKLSNCDTNQDKEHLLLEYWDEKDITAGCGSKVQVFLKPVIKHASVLKFESFADINRIYK